MVKPLSALESTQRCISIFSCATCNDIEIHRRDTKASQMFSPTLLTFQAFLMQLLKLGEWEVAPRNVM